MKMEYMFSNLLETIMVFARAVFPDQNAVFAGQNAVFPDRQNREEFEKVYMGMSQTNDIGLIGAKHLPLRLHEFKIHKAKD